MTARDNPGWGTDSGSLWPSPAKLNLFLHITGRRDDGYHSLQTVFQLLDYGDELAFVKRSDSKITLTINPHSEALDNANNLVLLATNALARQARTSNQAVSGVDITLYKRLPMGAGLGGGSSNAATALVALNHLWQLGFSAGELAQIGLPLGADVPVFVRARSAWAEGIGEILEPIELPERWFVVLNPPVHVATASLFSLPELTRDCAPITIRGFRNGVPTTNVFEPLVCRLNPEVDRALDELRREANQHSTGRPRMTGTGSSVFLECKTQSGAQKVLDAVAGRSPGLRGFVARGVEHSGLVHYL